MLGLRINHDGTTERVHFDGENAALSVMQEVVGGYITSAGKFPLNERRDAYFVCNDEGLLIGLPIGLAIHQLNGYYTPIAGNIFLSGVNRAGETVTLSETDLRHIVVREATESDFVQMIPDHGIFGAAQVTHIVEYREVI